MADFDRLERPIDWIDLGFIEREWTPREIVEVGIQARTQNGLQVFSQSTEGSWLPGDWTDAGSDLVLAEAGGWRLRAER